MPLQTFVTTQEIIPTGIKAYPATTAHGILTLTNGSVVTQELPQGMIFSGSGVEVITDEVVIVPAGSASGFGVATVVAHSLVTGAKGNLTTLSINAVYGTSLFIRNLSPFTGGKDSYSVQIVTEKDKQTALGSARASLIAQVKRRQAILAKPCKESIQGQSMQKVVIQLNNMGIPSPKGSIWSLTTIASILQNPILYGEVYTNRYKQVSNTVTETGKRSVVMKLRPQPEWIRLPDAPSVISRETFDAVQKQIQMNRRESLRNNRHPEELGLLRAGYITCGICGSNMFVLYPSQREQIEYHKHSPRYVCQQRDGGTELIHNHRTQIHLPKIEQAVRETISQSVSQPDLIRHRVEDLLAAYKKNIDTDSIKETLVGITTSMRNLYKLAEHATTDETIAELATRMNQLENQKRQAEAMLSDLADEEEQFAQVEKELRKFEEWAKQVRPFLADPSYIPAYEELRLAVQTLDIHVTVYPGKGDYPFRYQIEVRVPQIVKGLVSTASNLAEVKKDKPDLKEH